MVQNFADINLQLPKQKACLLNGQCQIGEAVHEGTLPSNRPNYKEKKYFGIIKESFKGQTILPQFIFQKQVLKK